MIQNFEFKYKIKEKLESLTHTEYKTYIKSLPKALRISSRTFLRYLYTRIDDLYSMPADHMAQLARFFNCKIEDLLNYEPPPLTGKKMKAQKNTDLIQKFKFVK